MRYHSNVIHSCLNKKNAKSKMKNSKEIPNGKDVVGGDKAKPKDINKSNNDIRDIKERYKGKNRQNIFKRLNNKTTIPKRTQNQPHQKKA